MVSVMMVIVVIRKKSDFIMIFFWVILILIDLLVLLQYLFAAPRAAWLNGRVGSVPFSRHLAGSPCSLPEIGAHPEPSRVDSG